MSDHVKSTSGPRAVHEIARASMQDIQGNMKHAIVAFIQWGTSETGYRYENVCPFCAETIGYVEEKIDAMGVPEEVLLKPLLNELLTQRITHFNHCQRQGAYRLAIVKTSKPLGTEHIIQEA